MNEKRVELGDRVKDRITGLKGIVTGVSEWLYGCRRLSVQPEEAKDAKPAETFWIDEPQAEIVKKAVVTRPVFGDNYKSKEPPRSHGPRSDFQRRIDAKR